MVEAKVSLSSVCTNYLEYLRENLILPYIRESENAKALGWTVENDQLIESDGSYYEGVFPDSLRRSGHELIDHMDSVRKAMIQDKHVTATNEEMATAAKMESTFASMNQLVVPYANWRIKCSEYLHVLAKSSVLAFDKFMADDNPYNLYGAIMALSTMYKGSISDGVGECIGMLLAIHLRVHGVTMK